MSEKNENLSLDAALEMRFDSLRDPQRVEVLRLDLPNQKGAGASKAVPPPVPLELRVPPPSPATFEKSSWLEMFTGPKTPAVDVVMRGVEPNYFSVDGNDESVPYLPIGTSDLSTKPTKTVVAEIQVEDNAREIKLDISRKTQNQVLDATEQPVDLTATGSHRIKTSQGEIWVSGSSLLCSCPECGAPMTIRLWLRLADCWRCPASIALDEETVKQAEKLVRKKSKPLPLPPPSPADFFSRQPLSTIAPKTAETTQPTAARGFEVDPRQVELERLTEGSILARALREGFKITPAWLVSFMLHLIALLILAMIILGDSKPLRESITLSTFLSAEDETGGDIRFESPLDTLQDDTNLASKMNVSDRELRDVIQQAHKDAMELRDDPDAVSPLPDLDKVRENLTTRPDRRMSFATRDPRVRAEIVKKEGGTNLTEAAVSRGLRWLASVQNTDGSWSLKNYSRSNRPGNRGDTMGTALALLPFLGAGQSHEFGIYKQNVANGLRWLLENQRANGDLRDDVRSQSGMYAHGQAAIVLCEALALTGDQQFSEPAQRAIAFIEVAQHREGGWRYQPGQPGDTSVFGWQMMALQSARAPRLNISVDDSTLRLADFFLDKVSSPAKKNGRKLPIGATYCYQPGRPSTAAMTAEAILCRMYLGWGKDDPRLVAAVDWLMTEHFPSSRENNLYYWYYGTQVMHNYSGKKWEKWNGRMRELLVSSQDRRGSAPGSWNPKPFEWGGKGGRIYTTSLAVCTLEVYYRHLPLFHPIDLENVEAARDF